LSDISIQFPWWASVVFVLIYSFWPLTIAVVVAGTWVFFARRSRIAWVVASVIAIPWLISAAGNVYAQIDNARTQRFSEAYDRSHRKTLTSDSVVSGMDLPAGTVLVTNDSFQLSSLELSRPSVLFGVPLTGTVSLSNARLDGSQTLQHDATIDGLPCAASDGVSFQNGRLTDCRLTRTTTIDGVPCGGYVAIHAGFLGCVLAKPYNKYGATWYEGTDVRGGDDYITFTPGSRAPSLRIYGSPLPQGTIVVYRNRAIDSVTLNAPLHYRGCTITSLERRSGGMTAEVDGRCSLPALPNGRVSVPNF
jgi:hypothetical protein